MTFLLPDPLSDSILIDGVDEERDSRTLPVENSKEGGVCGNERLACQWQIFFGLSANEQSSLNKGISNLGTI